MVIMFNLFNYFVLTVKLLLPERLKLSVTTVRCNEC